MAPFEAFGPGIGSPASPWSIRTPPAPKTPLKPPQTQNPGFWGWAAFSSYIELFSPLKGPRALSVAVRLGPEITRVPLESEGQPWVVGAL